MKFIFERDYLNTFCRLKLKSLFFVLLFVAFSHSLHAQPYFDVAGISMWQMPGKLNADEVTETEVYCFVSLPINLGKNDKIIPSPFYESRFLEQTEENGSERLQSLTLPIAWIHQFRDSSWSILTFGALRSNSTQLRFTGDVYQVAGAVLLNYKVTPALTLKTGVYISKEFYGDFYMWLVGIEWRVNNRLNVFGLVNNNLRMEYKFKENFHGGFAFKAINTSYRENGDGGYYKISDNHLCAYADFNISEKFVWNIEAGHTILRYIKSRNGAPFKEINKDGPVFKTGIAYRIRLWN